MEDIQYACRTCNEPHSLRTCSLCNSFILSMQCLKSVLINNKLCTNCTLRRMDEILLKEYRQGFIVPKYEEKLAFLMSYHDPHRCSKCWKVSIKRKMCSACGTAGYCSKKCQIHDWEIKHKVDCKEMKLSRSIIYDENYPLPSGDIPIIVEVATIGGQKIVNQRDYTK